MNNDIREDIPTALPGDQAESNGVSTTASKEKGWLARWTDTLLQLGLGELLLRAGSSLLTLVLVGIVVWLVQMYFKQAPELVSAAAQEAIPTAGVLVEAAPAPAEVSYDGIPRMALPYTIIPSRPRQEIVKYTVQEGDTVFGIAEKYGLEPQTIFWGNYNILLDDPHALRPGHELNILPVNGTYYEWQQGDGLNGVARFFGVAPEEIINFPSNNLDLATIGDFSRPNISAGTMLIVPGGRREFISWSAPLGVTRDNPATARILGAGACDPVSGGAVGFGNFLWPTNLHFLSGFDFSPSSNHFGIDLAGEEGDNIYASDSGVVVYAGWNDYGYGNMIIVDHGRFQTLYAHLSVVYVGCAQSVDPGQTIGLMGSTGRSSGSHLHFEIMTPGSKLNPWDFLPPP